MTKNSHDKISPMRADGKIGKNFYLAKISTYTVMLIANNNYSIMILSHIEMCFINRQ